MSRVNGFYGHIVRNNFRSLWMFAGFFVSFHLIVSVLLALPILILSSMDGKIPNLIFMDPIGYFSSYGLWVSLFGVCIFLFQILTFKHNLQNSLGFRTIEKAQNPRLFRIIESLAITAGISMPAISILQTNSCNAFACGFTKNSATIIITEGLLKKLDDDELSAVIAHEITHIVNADIRSMAFTNITVSSLNLLSRLNPLKVRGTKTVVLLVLFSPLIILFLSAGFFSSIAQTISKISRYLIASSREYIADAEAVRLTHNPAALISALQKIEGHSIINGLDPLIDAMMIDGASVGEFATHPTIAERISVLRKHSGAMAYDTATRKDTRASQYSQNFANGFNNSQPLEGQVFSPTIANSGNGGFGRRNNMGMNPSMAATSSNFTSYNKTMPETNYNKKAPKSLINRVNVNSKENAFGLTSSITTKLIIGFLVLFVFQQVAFKGVEKSMRANTVISNSDDTSSEITTTKRSLNVMKFDERK